MKRSLVILLSLLAYAASQCTFECYEACHTTVEECTPPGVACTTQMPFYCPSTTSCVANIDTCKNSSDDCDLGTDVKCWDGNCANGFHLCSAVPTCPVLFKRCGSGCIDERDPCPPQGCTGTLCADGHCALDGICSPYNGCTEPTPIECADGSCSSSLAGCSSCSGGVTCWDGSCEEANSLCAPAPGIVKPKSFVFTLSDNTIGNNFYIVDMENTRRCRVSFPANVFADNTRLLVQEVADSVLREATHEEWPTGESPIFSILSTAFQISFEIDNEVDMSGEYSIACVVSFRGELEAEDSCLASLDPDGNWECVQTELIPELFGEVLYLSANVDHFGTFAIIRNDKPDPITDSSTGDNPTVIIIIVVVVVVVLLIVVGAILAWFFLIRKKDDQQEEDKRRSWSSPSSSDAY